MTKKNSRELEFEWAVEVDENKVIMEPAGSDMEQEMLSDEDTDLASITILDLGMPDY